MVFIIPSKIIRVLQFNESDALFVGIKKDSVKGISAFYAVFGAMYFCTLHSCA